MQKLLVCVSIAVTAGAASAQGVRPDPARPAETSQKPSYESAFDRYRRWTEEELVSWRAANDEVGRLGGHAGYAKPAAEKSKEKKK